MIESLQFGEPDLRKSGARGADEQDRLLAHRGGEAGEERAPLVRREVQIVDAQDQPLLGGECGGGAGDDRLQSVLAERLDAGGRRSALEQRGERRHQRRVR